MERYNRHIILSEIGPGGQEKISRAKVLVVGAGGLGCPILQYIVAAGVGTVGVIDFDTVEISNLQRQVLFGTSTLKQNKAIAAKERLEDLNSNVSIHAYPCELIFDNALELFPLYDVIVDASDNFKTRYLINDACVKTNKPWVFGAIYKFQGQISVFNYNNGPTYKCAFPSKPEKLTSCNCSEVGVLGVLPGIIGTMQANEVLKIILGLGNVLSGKLLFYDALSSHMSTFDVKRNEPEVQKIKRCKKDFLEPEGKSKEGIEIPTISIKDLLRHEGVQFIDVREPGEQPKVQFLNITQLPLSELRKNIGRIERSTTIGVFCQSGHRSKSAVAILQEHKIESCFSIEEGASEINRITKEAYKNVVNGK